MGTAPALFHMRFKIINLARLQMNRGRLLRRIPFILTLECVSGNPGNDRGFFRIGIET